MKLSVNRGSLLMDFDYFIPCDGSLIPDVKLDVLEGILQYEAKLLLKYYTQTRKLFSLTVLNRTIAGMHFGLMEWTQTNLQRDAL